MPEAGAPRLAGCLGCPAPELRQLLYFVTVVQTGSISGAARALGVAQPAVSRQMRCLEATLGAPLLLRSGHGSDLTAPGRRAYRHALRILEGVASLLHDLHPPGTTARAASGVVLDIDRPAGG